MDRKVRADIKAGVAESEHVLRHELKTQLMSVVERNHSEDSTRINELIHNLENKNAHILEQALNKLFVNEKMHELQTKILMACEQKVADNGGALWKRVEEKVEDLKKTYVKALADELNITKLEMEKIHAELTGLHDDTSGNKKRIEKFSLEIEDRLAETKNKIDR